MSGIYLKIGFNFGDASYNDFGKRDVSNISNPFGKRNTYNGMPYSIYQATPGYQYKKGICMIYFLNIFFSI